MLLFGFFFTIIGGFIWLVGIFRPDYILRMVFGALCLGTVTAYGLTKVHAGIPVIGASGASIRQESTGTNVVYFGTSGHYGRNHMGGGLMGGK